jgi:large subunit ribosomal protein L15
MKIHDLAPAEGSRKNRKRVGRGPGSGHGKTACRGHKGQNSRSGGGVRPGFEGGQMPIHRRLPKRGFTNIFKKEYLLVNLDDLKGYEENKIIDREMLEAAGIVKKKSAGIKLLGRGDIDTPMVIKVDKVSRSARAKIEAAGGKVEMV